MSEGENEITRRDFLKLAGAAAAVALKEANPKLTAPEIVDQLKSMSDETTYQRYVGAEFVKARVFSPNKLKEKIEVNKP